MTIEMKFFTSDGEMHDTRRKANTHQRILDAHGMLENLLAITFSAYGFEDDARRNTMVATMLYTHSEDVISLLKGKPINNPDINPAELEAMTGEVDQPEGAIDLSVDCGGHSVEAA
jgi:hypothetical protein